MPYKSDAQRRKFHALLQKGQISQKVVKEFDQASKGMELPEKVGDRKHMKRHGYTVQMPKRGG